MCEIASENPFTNQNVFREDDSLLLIMSKKTLRQASMPKEQSYSFECWNSIEFLKFNGIVHMTGAIVWGWTEGEHRPLQGVENSGWNGWEVQTSPQLLGSFQSSFQRNLEIGSPIKLSSISMAHLTSHDSWSLPIMMHLEISGRTGDRLLWS